MIFSRSSLTPIGTGFVLVEQRVTWQAGRDPVRQATLSFSLTHVSALRLSPEASLQPAAQPTMQVPPTVEFVQSSASNFSVWVMGLSEHCDKVVVTQLWELQTRICAGVAVKVAYLSGQCCCTRLGLVALCALGGALFLQSETVAIVKGTCWWNGASI